MTSALRSGAIDIGFPFLIGVTVSGLAGMSSSAVAAIYARANLSSRTGGI
jgi:hypothetical protein